MLKRKTKSIILLLKIFVEFENLGNLNLPSQNVSGRTKPRWGGGALLSQVHFKNRAVEIISF